MVFLVSFLLVSNSATCQDYFQQEVNYDIQVTLDDNRHQLNAFEVIEYVNNSNETLHYIWFHLWPNAYKNGRTDLAKQMRQDEDLTLFFSKHKDRGWIDSLRFEINGQPARMEFAEKRPDVCRVFLETPLSPGETVIISTPFRVQIPKGIFSRLGHLDQAYQITQWYPKPAVYDNDGWHPMPYLGQGEFYSEFGSFDVKITLPKNYVVGATGDLVNGEEELSWLNQKVEQTKAIIDSVDYYDLSFPPSSKEKKTLHYHQENVHDFAWFADKRYHVLKGEVELPASGRTVTTWAMFTNNEADLWKNSIQYLNDATNFYSKWVGEYPYNHVTAVDGVLSEGGGMEYPNITLIGESGDAISLEEVILHEVGHNWFYGILASNERDNPWLDEGMNSFLELRYMRERFPNLKVSDIYGGGKLINFGMKWLGFADIEYDKFGHHAYRAEARVNRDQPIQLHSNDYTSINYGSIVYTKTAIAMDYLMQYLGKGRMNLLMAEYYQRWKFKHPKPSDFRKVAVEVTGDSLNWFFDGIINSADKIDYSLGRITKSNDSLKIRVNNLGKIAAPFQLAAVQNGDTIDLGWQSGFEKSDWISVNCPDCERIIIDPNQIVPDINLKNNSMRVNGVFRKVETIQPRFVAYYEDPTKTQFALAPTLGWNTYDGFMLGFAVYNNLMPKNKFSYSIMPMWAFGSRTLTGSARLAYTFHQRQQYPNVTIAVSGHRFNVGRVHPFYNPTDRFSPELPRNIIRPELKFDFIPRKRRSNREQSIRLRNTMYINQTGKLTRNIPQITYKWSQAFAPHIGELTADLQWLNNEAKFSIEAIYRFKFKRGYGFRARVFFGKFITRSTTRAFNFRMSSFREFEDYLYDGTFIGRSPDAGFLNQQMMEADGGFKSSFRVGQSDDWVLALNLSSTVYRKVPIEFFASVGTYANAQNAYPGSQLFLAEMGVSVVLIRDVLEVHFPFLYSKNIRDELKLTTDNYGQQIRFTFNLNELKPQERLQRLLN